MILRRRRPQPPDASPVEPAEDAADQPDSVEPLPPSGPYDVTEVDLDPEDPTRIDLGGLVVRGLPGTELQLQVDQASGLVVAAMLVTADAGLELRPFAAPRNESIWAEIRREIAAEATRRGGTASEVDGEHGVELRVVVPAQTPDGRSGSHISRVVGVDGPRWLLRGTFLGRAALEPDAAGVLEQAFREVVVVRGGTPMAPRDALPLTMPGAAGPTDAVALGGDSPSG